MWLTCLIMVMYFPPSSTQQHKYTGFSFDVTVPSTGPFFLWLVADAEYLSKHVILCTMPVCFDCNRGPFLTTVPISVSNRQKTWQCLCVLALCHVAGSHRRIVVTPGGCESHQHGHCEARVTQHRLCGYFIQRKCPHVTSNVRYSE